MNNSNNSTYNDPFGSEFNIPISEPEKKVNKSKITISDEEKMKSLGSQIPESLDFDIEELAVQMRLKKKVVICELLKYAIKNKNKIF